MEAKNPKQTYGLFPTQNYFNFSFFYEKEERQGQSELYVRPFYSTYSDKLTNSKFSSSFYPLYYSQSTDKWKKWTFLFLFSGDTWIHEDVGQDEDLSITPLFVWGKGDTDRERYISFFPIYGTLKNKLSWSSINYILFPLYVDWEYKDFRAKSILWPLTIYGSNEIRKEYRFLPFYSQKSHIGKFSHTSILWPFISYGVDNLDKKEPSSYSFFWLLYAKKESYYGNQLSFGFMPIIGSISLFSYGYDNRTTEKDYSALFFLLQYGYSNDKDYRKYIFFPFYGYSRYANKEFTFITPFIYKMETDTYLIKSNSYYLIPFYHYNYQNYIKEERTDSYLKIWPLFLWHRDFEGNLNWNFLSLYPIRSETAEKVWDPIFSIIEYKKLINGEKRFSLMMRLYSQRWSENENHWNVPLFVDYSSKDEITKFRIFYGFLGYEKSENKSIYQFLWFIKI